MADQRLTRRPGFCTQGHPMAGENLYLSPNGKKVCRECRARRKRSFKERRTALTHKRLLELLTFEESSGNFIWKVARAKVRVGDIAGYVRRLQLGQCRQEYLFIEVEGWTYPAHRLAWFYMTGLWPECQIDHKDLNGLNNRKDNLRPATRAQNKANNACYANNSLGVKGVSQRGKRFIARIRVNKELVYLGRFDTAEAAHAAYVVAAEHHYGEYARAA
jgi:hypothetical protein